VRTADGEAVAGLSISMPSVRYDAHRLPSWVAALGVTARVIEEALAAASDG
jgi:DNA-binding IclR family transcriptional regulator